MLMKKASGFRFAVSMCCTSGVAGKRRRASAGMAVGELRQPFKCRVGPTSASNLRT